MSQLQRTAYDAVIITSEHDLDQLLMLLLEGLEYKAIISKKVVLPLARLLIINLDDPDSAFLVEKLEPFHGRGVIGISRQPGTIPEIIKCKCRTVLLRPLSFGEFREAVSVAYESIGKLSIQPTAAQVKLDVSTRHIYSEKASVKLTPSEYALLSCLLTSRGKPVARQDLAALVGGGESNKTDVYISNIRRKMKAAFGITLIHTVRGIGYMVKE